jgi:hypothetical protein
LAVRALDAAIFGDCRQIESLGLEMAKALDNDGIAWAASGFGSVAEVLSRELDTELLIEMGGYIPTS